LVLLSRHFTSFVAIDWSGAKGSRQRGIAVATCGPGKAAPTLIRPGHIWSRSEILDWLLDELPDNSLVGMDLSPSLPFEDCGAFFPGWDESPTDARALWALVEQVAADDPYLAATSFVDHPEASRHFRRHGGRTGDRFGSGAGRFRRVESRQRDHQLSPYSCMNLVGAAQVGKSSLTGMRLLNRLSGRVPIWPFDSVPKRGSVIVEIYTSLAARKAGVVRGRSKLRDAAALDAALAEFDSEAHVPLRHYTDHATDAILTAAWLRRAAPDPALWNPKGLDEVRYTEGWTFGIL
jgi:hypothetical protein